MSGNRPLLSVVLPLLLCARRERRGEAMTQSRPKFLSSGATTPTAGELAIVRAMNVVRMRRRRRPLRVGPALTRAARSHSADMARRGYFDHGAFVQRLRSFGVRRRTSARTSPPGRSRSAAAAIVQMWIASPGHRGILLDRGFRLVGVGVAGGATKLVTADFAGR